MKKWPLFLLIALFFSACGDAWIPISIDQTLGEQAKDEILNDKYTYKILTKEECPQTYLLLEDLRNQILENGNLSHKNDFTWEIKIIEDDSVLNAFCVPGGYIFVYTGLIKYLNSKAALAGVLGHEMAHADRRHSTKQMAKQLGLSVLLQYVLGIDQSSLLNLGANLLGLSFSRSDESEADNKSVEYLYNTEIDARGAAFFFEQLQHESNKDLVPEFISTHPNPENRIENIYAKWKELGAKKGNRYELEYNSAIQDLP